ncbi:MAG: MATE family efflux transporter [Clostridiales bacterium]|nr:MATE family efflux transporter [Clostridiales bacterium]
MTTRPVEKLICSLAVPTIISMLVTALYNIADTFFVSNLGNDQTGAVGVVFPVMALIQAVGFFFGQGSGNYISRALGKGDPGSASKMASVGFFTSFVFTGLLAFTALFFAEPIAEVLGSTALIRPHAVSYMKWILLGAPFMASSYVLNNQLRFQGNALYSMIGIGVGAVVNVGLDPLFISVLDMGVSGAALATVISQLLSFCLLLVATAKSDSLKIRLRNYRFEWKYYREIFIGGTPSLFRQGLSSVATAFLNRAAGICGAEAAIAAMTVVSKLMQFATSALIGFGQGFQPVCGFNWGAGLYGRVRKAILFCLKVSVTVLVAIAAAGIIFAPWIIGIFRDDETVIRIGAAALRAQCAALPLTGVTIMTNMALQNIGKVFRATLLAMSRQGLMFIPVVLILPALFGLGGVVYSQCVADVLAFAVALPLLVSLFRELKKRACEQEGAR